MAVKFEYDLNEDFVEVKNVFIKEVLTQEEKEEGLEPEEINLKVAITAHADKRMNDTEDRDCEWNLVEELILEKSNVFFQVKNGEEFILVNENQTIALCCHMHQQNGEAVLILITVIRKIYMNNNQEYERKVHLNRKANTIY